MLQSRGANVVLESSADSSDCRGRCGDFRRHAALNEECVTGRDQVDDR